MKVFNLIISICFFLIISFLLYTGGDAPQGVMLIVVGVLTLVFLSVMMFNAGSAVYWKKKALQQERSNLKFKVGKKPKLNLLEAYLKRYRMIAESQGDSDAFRDTLENALAGRYIECTDIYDFADTLFADQTAVDEKSELLEIQKSVLLSGGVKAWYRNLFMNAIQDAKASKRFSVYEKLLAYTKKLQIYEPATDPEFQDSLEAMESILQRKKALL